MGKGMYMVALNLDSATHSSKITNRNCVYADGQDGSWLSKFNAQYPPMGSVPALGTPPIYVEANGSGGCAFEQSRFTFNFDGGGNGGGYIGINIQTSQNPVTRTGSGGPLWADIGSNDNFFTFKGQAALGILRTNQNPPSAAPFASVPGASWMQQAIAANPDFRNRTLSMVSFPASHDSGMSKTTKCTTFGNARITQTQTSNIAGQLNFGVRYFDLRPAVWSIDDSRPTLYTGHFSSAVGGQGCLGEKLGDILGAVASFVKTNPQEIVFLKFSHYSDNDARSFPVALQRQMITQIQGALQSSMLTAGVGEKVGLRTVGGIIDGGRRVICVFDDLDPSLYNPLQGILRFGSVNPASYPPVPAAQQSNLDIYDSYTGTENTVMMMVDQLNKYNQFSQAQLTNGELFLLSYTLTLSDLGSTPVGGGSILGLAAKANQWLWQYATGIAASSSSPRPPNFIYVDAVDGTSPLQAALYFNSVVQRPLALSQVAICSSAFTNLALRCGGGATTANCQWGVDSWERFTLVPAQTQGQYYLQSVPWGVYLTLNPQGATQPNGAGVGVAAWSATQTPSALLSIQSTGDGRYTIGSVQYPNVYLRMDGTGVTVSNGSGVGVANCQIGAGAWEMMYIEAA
jgi:hypothetical protein